MMNTVCFGDNLYWLKRIKDKSVDLIYIDPPFNTGRSQKIHGRSYEDSFDDFIRFIAPRLIQARRILKDTGSIFVHLDYREVHYVKVYMDKLFGRHNFRNEIIWAYDYGGRSKGRWSPKHDTILWYTRGKHFTYIYEAIDRIPYLAPGLVGREKAAKGKTPTDVWWNTIVPTQGKERVGYPTQKPLAIIRRLIKVHSHTNDRCLDFFCGSGTFGVACKELGRKFLLVDQNPQAIKIIKRRLGTKNIRYLRAER